MSWQGWMSSEAQHQHSTAVPKRRSCSISLACGSSRRDGTSALLLNHRERNTIGLIHLHQTDSVCFQAACPVGQTPLCSCHLHGMQLIQCIVRPAHVKAHWSRTTIIQESMIVPSQSRILTATLKGAYPKVATPELPSLREEPNRLGSA